MSIYGSDMLLRTYGCHIISVTAHKTVTKALTQSALCVRVFFRLVCLDDFFLEILLKRLYLNKFSVSRRGKNTSNSTCDELAN